MARSDTLNLRGFEDGNSYRFYGQPNSGSGNTRAIVLGKHRVPIRGYRWKKRRRESLAGCSKTPSSKAAAELSPNKGWLGSQLRAFNEGSPRPRVARGSTPLPRPLFQHPAVIGCRLGAAAT